ncbi:MAG: ribonuclease III [Lachnospiraceae bacterium]
MKYDLEELQNRIGYSFHDVGLLEQAVTHSSYANERTIRRIPDYERIEFLGDAVLETVSSEFIFREHTSMSEGNMTKLRASLVCEPALAYCARKLELGRFLNLGKGEERCGGRERDSIIADVMEAITGAIYLDGGMEQAKAFILGHILNDVDNSGIFYDSKSTLQEMIQRTGGVLRYELIDESGPEHDKTFTARVLIDDIPRGVGSGHNKKQAEQKAAYEAIVAVRKAEKKQ